MTTLSILRELLQARLDEGQARWFAGACGELASGVADARFCALISQASRFCPRGDLAPTAGECSAAASALKGWDPSRWTALEALRVALCLERRDLDQPSFVAALEEAFRFADMGEACALYRLLAHLPGPERFTARAGEGARSNMRSVFEAACLDTPYPGLHFDDVAWRSAVVKALFVEAPLWRLHGLDGRLDAELAIVALDLADERRSAGRPVNPELWLCLGTAAGARGLESLERELTGPLAGDAAGRAAACLALARAGEQGRLEVHAESETDDLVQAKIRAARSGRCDQRALADLPQTSNA